MARTEITPQALSRAGVTPTLTLITSDNVAVKNLKGNVFLKAINTSASPVVLTIYIAATIDGQSVTSRTVSLAATGSSGDEKIIGPFPTSEYNQTDALVNIDAATADVVNLAAFSMEVNK